MTEEEINKFFDRIEETETAVVIVIGKDFQPEGDQIKVEARQLVAGTDNQIMMLLEALLASNEDFKKRVMAVLGKQIFEEMIAKARIEQAREKGQIN